MRRQTITLNQRRLARNIKNYAQSPVRVNAETLLVDSGYTKKTANASAKLIFAQPGLKLALAEEGISLDNADHVVKSILNSPIVYEMVTPDNQLRAADYIAKRIGGFAPDKHININVTPIYGGQSKPSKPSKPEEPMETPEE